MISSSLSPTFTMIEKCPVYVDQMPRKTQIYSLPVTSIDPVCFSLHENDNVGLRNKYNVINPYQLNCWKRWFDDARH